MPPASQHRATILTFKVENKLIFQGVVQKKNQFCIPVYQVFVSMDSVGLMTSRMTCIAMGFGDQVKRRSGSRMDLQTGLD